MISRLYRSMIILVFVALALNSCKTNETETDGRMHIVTTTGMIGDLVQNIAGSEVLVESIMGPGTDPHYYTPKQSDRSKMKSCDVIFYNGLRLEGEMGEIFERYAETKPVFAISDGIDDEFIHYPDDGVIPDPHIWFDVQLWIAAAGVVKDRLVDFDPVNAEVYKSNWAYYVIQLEELHSWVEMTLDEIPNGNRLLVTSHDAFGYFARAYDFEVKGLQGVSTAAEAGLKDITELVDEIVRLKIPAIFVETSVSDKGLRAVQESCRQKGHDVNIGGSLFSDAMGDAGTEEGTYLGMVRKNILTIVNALK